MKNQFLFILLVIISCNKSHDNLEIDRDLVIEDQFVNGTISDQDTIVDKFGFRHCFCNLTDSGVVVGHINRGGFVGESLLTHIGKDSVKFQFETWSDYGRPPKYYIQNSHLIINRDKFKLRETLEGQIEISGYGNDFDDKKINFDVKGTFRCVLKDSTYDYSVFFNDLINYYDSLEMVKLKDIAHCNSDSVIKLHLNHKNFDVIRDDLSLFKNLQQISLENFPSSDLQILSQLPSLRELNITNDSMKQFPSSITSLVNLKKLYINSDSMKEVPIDISRLTNLESLTISSPITRIPNSLFSLAKLRELDLGATNITEISIKIKNLKDLEKLDITYSEITRVPAEIFDLPNLRELGLPDTIQLYKLKKFNKSLTKLDAPFEFLNYNAEALRILRNLETATVTFHYKDWDEERRLHSLNLATLHKILPNTDINEVAYLDD